MSHDRLSAPLLEDEQLLAFEHEAFGHEPHQHGQQLTHAPEMGNHGENCACAHCSTTQELANTAAEDLFASLDKRADNRDTEAHADYHEHGAHPPGCTCEVHQHEATEQAADLFDNLFQSTSTAAPAQAAEKAHHHEHEHVHGPHCNHDHHTADAVSDALHQELERSGHDEHCASPHCVVHHPAASQQAEQLFNELTQEPIPGKPIQNESVVVTQQEQTVAPTTQAETMPTASQLDENLHIREALLATTTEPTTTEAPLYIPSAEPEPLEAPQTPRPMAEITVVSTSAPDLQPHEPVAPDMPHADTEIAIDEIAGLPELPDTTIVEVGQEFTESIPLPLQERSSADEPAMIVPGIEPMEPIQHMSPVATEYLPTPDIHPAATEITIVLQQLIPEIHIQPTTAKTLAEVVASSDTEDLRTIHHTINELLTQAAANSGEIQLSAPVVLLRHLEQLSVALHLQPAELLELLEFDPNSNVLSARTLEILAALQKLLHEEYRQEFMRRFILPKDDAQQPPLLLRLGTLVLSLVRKYQQQATVLSAT